MPLALKTRQEFVQDNIAAVQAALTNSGTKTPFQFQIGSIVLAIIDAQAGTALWEESLVQFVLAQTRLATSTGEACDTWVADFGLKRLPATPSGGNVTFSSFTFTTQRLIPVATLISTPSPQPNVPTPVIGFSVVADPANAFFNASLNAYVVPPGTQGISVPVVSTSTGTGSNVAANTVTVINSPIVGIDTVINPDAFQNGEDAQSDPALRAFFVQYINSLSKATKGALSFAIESLGQSIKFDLVENIDYTTQTERRGYFYAVVDNGAGGVPDNDFLNVVRNALEVVRGFTIEYEVQPVILTPVNVDVTITIPGAYSASSTVADQILIDNVNAALSLYIELVPVGVLNDIYYTRIAQIVYNTIATTAPAYLSETNVTGLLVNSGTADLAGDSKHEFSVGTLNITVANS